MPRTYTFEGKRQQRWTQAHTKRAIELRKQGLSFDAKLDLEKTVIKAKDQATGKEASVSAMTVFIDALSVISKVSGETNG